MKILITGGHIAPAIAVIDYLQKQKSAYIIFVGRKYALDREKTISFEYQIIKKKNIEFVSLFAGRLSRIISFDNLLQLIRIPIGFIQSIFIMTHHTPQVVISFGGYIALPIVFAAWLFHIPVYTHEQTIRPGLANRLIGYFAKNIFCAFEDAVQFFPKSKTIVSGNPVRDAVFEIRSKPFSFSEKLPVLYICGGSLGSHSINMHIMDILPSILKQFNVIHQTGDTKTYDDFTKLLKFKDGLPQELQQRYMLIKHFFEDEIGYVYSISDLVIGRSGANTVFELIALQKPAILIPLPWSAHQEQLHHATLLKQSLVGEIFFQSQTSQELLSMINRVVGSLPTYKNHFKNLTKLYNKNAVETICQTVFKSS